MNLQTERIQKWDTLKFLMIFLMVLGHAAEFFVAGSQAMRNLFMLIYTVHMPIFIFVSGLFSKKAVNEKRYDKIFGFLILYLVRKLLPYTYTFSGAEYISINFFRESGVPWFMLAIFAFYLLTIALKNYSVGYISVLIVAFACFAGYDANINDFLSLSRIIVFYPFFYFGYCADIKKLENLCKNKKLKIAAAAVIIIFVAVVLIWGESIYWLKPLLSGRTSYHVLEHSSKWGFLLRLGYYAVSCAVGFAVIILVPSKTPFGICAKLGQRTLAVYMFHYFAIYYIFEKFDCKTFLSSPSGNSTEWLIIPISIIVTLIFSAGFFTKILQFITNIPKRKSIET